MKVSIVIRSKNEERFIGQVLEKIFAQHYREPCEVLVLDSGSTDKTLEIVSHFPVRVQRTDPRAFTFGRALNHGAQLARGDYVVFLSAHCTPGDREWLARLLHPIEEDLDVVATYGRQEPRRGVNLFEEMELDWIFPSDGSRQPPVIFSSANCAIQREILLRYPFDESAPGAEDYIWRRLLPKAHRSVYVPSASVYHTHPLNLRYWAARFGIDGELIPYLSRTYGMEYYGGTSQAPLSSFLRWSYSLARREYRYCRDNRYLLHLLLIPFFEAFRISCFWRGLRRGRLRYAGSRGGDFRAAPPCH